MKAHPLVMSFGISCIFIARGNRLFYGSGCSELRFHALMPT